jgi:aryl-alcohol dehydrogenase-like predicted oxidoreductase
MSHDAGTATRTLGKTGAAVSAIGFGSWAIGGPHWRNGSPIGWGEVDDAESIAAIRGALDGGISFFDTADVYGCGHSERILAEALGSGHDDVAIATKFGYTYDEVTRESPGTDASPRYIRQACEASLGRLHRDVIDLYFFHLGDYPIESSDDVIETLESLVDEGKIRSFGWSTDDADRAEYIAQHSHCAAIEQAFNLFRGDTATLEVCERYGLASVVRSPLGMGLLTGAVTPARAFSGSDLRSGWDFDGDKGTELAALASIRDVLTRDGRSLTQGALGWLLARSDAFIPVPGIRTVSQAEENAGTLAVGALADDQMAEIGEILLARQH